MKFINGVSSFFLIVSALNSIKTKNCFWIFANFYIIFTSFMYNIHKFDIYEKYPNKIITLNELSDANDVYLFNDYIAVSLLAFSNIDCLFIKNIGFASFFIEYYYTKSIEKSNNIIFIIAIISKTLKSCNTYKKYSINKEILFSASFNLIIALVVLVTRYKYSYTRERQFLNFILTTIWHYNTVNILSYSSYTMHIELHHCAYNKYTYI